MKTKFLIVGESGSGKDTVCNKLELLYNYKVLKSYTTRKKRENEGNAHIFISEEEVEQYRSDMIAYTFFDENHYFATKQQFDDCHLYIIDPDGVQFMKEKLSDEYDIKIIYIKVLEHDRINRMNKRNDGLTQILQRLKNDNIKFKNIDFDYAIPNKDLDKCVEIIHKIIEIEK